MTDLLDAGPSTGRICLHEGCSEDLTTLGLHHFAKYCPEHAPAKKVKGKRRDRRPSSVNVHLPGPPRSTKKDKDLDAVERQVRGLLNMASVGLAMAGAAEDALDLNRGAEQVASAAKQLAEYEPWLRKFAAVEQTGRAMAWLVMLSAVAGMLAPILSRHGWMPKSMSGMLSGGPVMAPPSMPDTPSEPAPASAAAA